MVERNGASQLIGFDLSFELLLTAWQLSESTKSALLLLGLLCFSGGIVLMFRHQRTVREVQAEETDQRVLLFEHRKFRRRTTASCMVSCLGVFLASLYWVTAPRTILLMLSMILILLLGILGLAILDATSIGLNALGNPDKESRQKLVDEYLRKRRELDEKRNDENEAE